jgi:hypothetical protein
MATVVTAMATAMEMVEAAAAAAVVGSPKKIARYST